MNTQINLYSPYLLIDAYYVKNCSLVQILWVARHFFNMRFLAILPPLAMAIFALCHPTGVHVTTRPKMLRLTNGFLESTSSLAGCAFRGVRHCTFFNTKVICTPHLFCPWYVPRMYQ